MADPYPHMPDNPNHFDPEGANDLERAMNENGWLESFGPTLLDVDYLNEAVRTSSSLNPDLIAMEAEHIRLETMAQQQLGMNLRVSDLKMENNLWKADIYLEHGYINAEQWARIHTAEAEALHGETAKALQDLDGINKAHLEYLHTQYDMAARPENLLTEEAANKFKEADKALEDHTEKMTAAGQDVDIANDVVRTTEEALANANKQLATAEKIGDTEGAARWTEEVASIEATVKEQYFAQTKAQEIWAVVRSKGKNIDSLFNTASKTLEKVGGMYSEASYTAKYSKNVKVAIEAATKPVRDFSKVIARSGDLLIDGFQSYIKTFAKMEEGAEITYWNEIMRAVEIKSHPQVVRMEAQIRHLKDLGEALNAAKTTEQIAAAEARLLDYSISIASPSFRLYAASLDDFKNLYNTIGDGWKFLVPFRAVEVGLASVARISGSAVSVLVETMGAGIGRLAGSSITGRAVATGLVETSLSAVNLFTSGVKALMGWEVQLTIFTVQAEYAFHHSHNWYEFFDNMLHQIPIVGWLINFDPRKVKEYPEFSQIAVFKKEGEKAPIDKHGVLERLNVLNIHKIDSTEDHVVLDFWGEQYITVMNLTEHKQYPLYRRWKPWTAVMRTPGLYVSRDPQKHGPYETEAHCIQCNILDKELEMGELVDEGNLSNTDMGANLLVADFPRHKDDDTYVRNLVDFPLYDKGMTWPDLDGSPYQLTGTFSRDEIDPTIVATFELWATTGKYGGAYNSATHGTQMKKAIQNNLDDLHHYLKPSPENPNSYIDLREWVKSNKGKRVIAGAGMYKVTLEQMKEEYGQEGQTAYLRDTFLTTKGIFKGDDHKYSGLVKLSHDEKKGMNTGGAVPDYMYKFRKSDFLIRLLYNRMGRWPMHKEALDYYQDVVNGEYVHAYVSNWETALSGGIYWVWEHSTKKSSDFEISFFKNVLDSFTNYIAALEKFSGNVEKAYSEFIVETAWKQYVMDQQRERSLWGYISKYKLDFFNELQSVVLVKVAKRKNEVWQEYLKAVANANVPLNTNSYHRCLFMARMNQAIYNQDPKSQKSAWKSIHDKIGPILDERVITTGLKSVDINAWASHITDGNILKIVPDLPVFFGDLHCRIIVGSHPKPTVFIVFKGTSIKNVGEWLVDLDFTAADLASLGTKEGANQFGINVYDEQHTAGENLRDMFFTDKTKFSVHRGFLRAWKSFRPGVIDYLQKVYVKYAIQDVMVSGHSLGAGVGQLCCLEIPGFVRRDITPRFGALHDPVVYQRPHAYMFGSPCVGDGRFNLAYKEQTSESIQVFVDGDIVSSLPPMLMPAGETWRKKWSGYITELEQVGKAATGKAAAFAFANFLIGTVMHLPEFFKPLNWQDKDVNFDKGKALSNIVGLNTAFAKDAAQRGGGLFIRIDGTPKGEDVEHSYDFGPSESMIKGLINRPKGSKGLGYLHELNTHINGLMRMVGNNPDDFDVIDGKLPSWADANKKKHTPGKLHPIPRDKIDLMKAEYIGVAHTKRKYEPYSIVEPGDVDYKRYYPQKRKLSDVKKVIRDRKIHRYDNDYHSY